MSCLLQTISCNSVIIKMPSGMISETTAEHRRYFIHLSGRREKMCSQMWLKPTAVLIWSKKRLISVCVCILSIHTQPLTARWRWGHRPLMCLVSWLESEGRCCFCHHLPSENSHKTHSGHVTAAPLPNRNTLTAHKHSHSTGLHMSKRACETTSGKSWYFICHFKIYKTWWENLHCKHPEICNRITDIEETFRPWVRKFRGKRHRYTCQDKPGAQTSLVFRCFSPSLLLVSVVSQPRLDLQLFLCGRNTGN